MNDRLSVNVDGSFAYDITYNKGFDDLASFLNEYDPESGKKVCVVSDSKVASFYLDAILRIVEKHCSKAISFVFPEGEPSKNLAVVQQLYTKLIEEHFDRRDLLIALGGGVVGDLTGFTAATYLRGIDFLQVPTSLLADVDSSIGGKTGVDFDSYKNMVGAFHMPKLVYINIDTMDTLDERQFNSGMAEVIKSALIRNKDFFYFLRDNVDLLKSRDKEAISEMIYQCNIIKKNVVEIDPTEKKERALLNLGHTLGHAIEKYMNFEMLHGECVNIGTIMAGIISKNKGLISEDDLNSIVQVISKYDVPKLPLDLDYHKIIMYTKNDKKAVGNKIKFILLNSIGEGIISTDVSEDDMLLALEEYMKNYN
ncbi:MAG: 3-dehydroquinate synthase [Eubacterium sp.]|nr:3-dehydroquinate synthase [Eubacterium sp.]